MVSPALLLAPLRHQSLDYVELFILVIVIIVVVSLGLQENIFYKKNPTRWIFLGFGFLDFYRSNRFS